MGFQYRVTVIVPVYNKETFLDRSVTSLLMQTMPAKELEILLIDDGSTDSSPLMCDVYAEEFPNVFAFHKENGGLSDARNYGIERAHGKYIMYLDADDFLAEDTCASVADFFDKHYNEVDLVTYPCYSVSDNGEIEKLGHYRYRYMDKQGVYDLADDRFIYAAITQIYICVKNLGEDNVLFSFDREFRHEDQKYCTDVLLRKLKVGYCESGRYYYDRQPDGLTGTKFYAYYLFEKTMAFWEEEFAKYDGKVPRYLQALFVSDVGWKLDASILLPFHYEGRQFDEAVARIDRLLGRVDPDVIINHPVIDQFRAGFLLQRRPGEETKCISGQGALALVANDNLLFYRKGIEIIWLRSVPTDRGLTIWGFLKSPCFQYGEKPRMKAMHKVWVSPDDLSDDAETQTFAHDVPLRESSWCYYKTHVKTNQFWGFRYDIECLHKTEVSFLVDFCGETLTTNFYLSTRAIFSSKAPKRSSFVRGDILYSLKGGEITLTRGGKPEFIGAQGKQILKDGKSALRHMVARESAKRFVGRSRRIWLYHDCQGVEKNNAYDQFIHDFDMDDGIERYYVVNDPIETKLHLFNEQQAKHVIQFKSSKHKMLFLSAELIITAYVEWRNWSAFTEKNFKHYSDLFHARVVYLQHGVLHSHLPWKYSLDRLLIDKEVVSTQFEIDNLCENYWFEERDLIPAGMPRYDSMNHTAAAKRKILYAPSWREYLVRSGKDGKWQPVPAIFEKSSFYQELLALMCSPRLAEALEEHGYDLEVKLHPILRNLYEDLLLPHLSSRIKLAAESVSEEDYQIFITDFSSYRFDFVYLRRTILYFLPDEGEYRSGMCTFRETDLPLDGMFGDLAHTADELVDLLVECLSNGGEPKEEYSEQMEGFFLHYDNNQCERIYEDLMEGSWS